MRLIHPKIVTDERMHPIAVQIDYADWLKIQKIIAHEKQKKKKKLEKYKGTIHLTEDPLGYQKRIRNEWE